MPMKWPLNDSQKPIAQLGLSQPMFHLFVVLERPQVEAATQLEGGFLANVNSRAALGEIPVAQ